MTQNPTFPAVVYIIDDDASVRESLSSLMRAEGLAVEVFNGPQAFLEKNDIKDFACIVLDVCMPGMDGLTLQERMNERGIGIPIVFITGHGDVPEAVRAMKAGAIDFLRKPFEDFELLQAISLALSRVENNYYDKLELAQINERYCNLTPREREIILLVAKGKQNKVIALDLGVSESTVKVHRHNVMVKMKLRSIPELTLVMRRLGKF